MREGERHVRGKRRERQAGLSGGREHNLLNSGSRVTREPHL